MNLEIMLKRAEEIEAAIVNAAGQLNALNGHKAEVAHWIEQFKAAVEEPKGKDEVDSGKKAPVK